jgi:hypothetical protein
MKYLLALVLIAFSYQLDAQKIMKITRFKVVLRADSISVREAFSLLSTVTPRSKLFYELWVIKEGKRYYRPYISSMRKNRAYLVEKGKRMEKTDI